MFKTIVLPIDLDQASSWDKALPAAVDMARKYGSRLVLVNVVPEAAMGLVKAYLNEDVEQKILSGHADRLKQFRQEHLPDDLSVDVVTHYGSVYQTILKTAAEMKADVIVMASHHPQASDFLLGSNAARVVRHADCSVLVIRN